LTLFVSVKGEITVQPEQMLVMEGVTKSYSGITVLNNVNFDLKKGEVHALVGENGSGKSTMIKILMGIVPRNSGTIYINGKEVEFSSSMEAAANKVSAVFQELSMIPTLSVADNILLKKERRTKAGLLDKKKTLRQTAELFKKYNINNVPAHAIVSDLSTAQRQLTEIVKAVSSDPEIIIFDEPTSSLTKLEVVSLFEIIEEFKSRGAGIIYISHRMEEIFEITDRVTVLRDGEYVGTRNTKETHVDEIVSMMVGREKEIYKAEDKRDKTKGEVVLELKDVSDKTMFKDMNLKLYKGEILGLAGLVGSGRSELMNLIFGITKTTGGEILINGEKVKIKKPMDAIRHGICMIPENRHLQGLILMHSIEQNLAICNMERFKFFYYLLNFKKLASFTLEAMKKFDIRAESGKKECTKLSGGNQQKVVVAKWISRSPQILIVDEPTNGIDVGAKSQIHRILRQLSNDGVSIILISSEMTELLAHSDRVLVMNNFKIIVEASEITQEQIMTSIIDDISQENVMQAN